MHSGRRRAEWRRDQMVRRSRERGHDLLADWLEEGFRDGTFTIEGRNADPAALARTLAATKIYSFVDSDGPTGPDHYGFEVQAVDHVRYDGVVTLSVPFDYDLADADEGDLEGWIMATAFGGPGDDGTNIMSYLSLDELSPDPACGEGLATLDAWNPGGARRRRAPLTGPTVFRVRFAWADREGGFHLGRCEQAAHPRVEGERSGGSSIHLEGAPEIRELPDSRLRADRWDRLLLDALVVNRVVGAVATRRAAAERQEREPKRP
jgi:hypothetical protein